MIYKLLKKPFVGRFMVDWRNPLSIDQQAQWLKIDTLSGSGARIQGLFAQSSQSPTKATVVLGHPMGKEAKGYFLKSGYADHLLENGFNVIVFDFNGFGESENGNFRYYEDVLAIGNKARELSNDLPIGYHGVSLGAQWATIAFADDSHPYQFAILESSTTTLDEFWSHYPGAYLALKFLNVTMPRFREKLKMIEQIKEAKHLKSILYVYSESDEWTPVSMGKRFFENTPMTSELWTVKEAKHAEIVKSKFADSYKQKILNYLKSCTA
ncbi:MAG: alpha/beta hydrolase [Flavobacteriia bacterium]|nr:alpha/beta hydrolase [Flavobacteriia bacterium]